jgi:hypothetical protein
LESHRRPFSLNTIEAFDALVEAGVALEMRYAAPNNQAVTEGVRVKMQCSAMIWDGSNTEAHVFSEGILSFSIGKSQVTAGLEEATLKLHVDEEADIISAPLMAYGDAGQPPIIPPNAHIVFSVKILSVTSDPAELAKPAEGDPILFWTGISQRVTGASNALSHKAGAVMLVTDENASKTKEGEITDDMLAKAAAGMGMK